MCHQLIPIKSMMNRLTAEYSPALIKYECYAHDRNSRSAFNVHSFVNKSQVKLKK